MGKSGSLTGVKQIKERRIFILTNTLKTGGAEKQSIYLFNALSRKYDTSLIVYYGYQKDQRMLGLIAEDLENKVIFLEGSYFRKLTYLYKILKVPKNPVCISYLATTNIINAFIGRIAGVRLRIGGIRSTKFTWFKKVVQRHLHNYWLHHSVFNNFQGLALLIGHGFNPSKASVIHNAVEIPFIKTIDHETVTIMSVGRFVEAKDYITSINSIKIVNQSLPGFKYIIIGQGELEERIRVYIKELGLDELVEIVVNPDNVNQYYEQSDIYLSTSIFEGLSNSIMEAMSFGLPVVATEVGDNKYLIKEGETGFLCEVKDSATIAAKLELLIKNPDLRKSMGAKGRQRIIENFSVDKFTDSYIKLIETLERKY